MSSIRMWSLGMAVAIATVLDWSSEAHAQSRKMVVLIDASGSMSASRSDPTYPTRFTAAKQRARDQIRDQALLGLDAVAVYTFSDDTATLRSGGFVDPNDARALISTFDLFTVGGGGTPLAGSVCDVVDALVAEAPDPGDVRILSLASDGAENATPLGHPCKGPSSSIPDPPYSAGSWQNKVFNYVIDNNVAPFIDLFDYISVAGSAPLSSPSDPEASATAAFLAASGTGDATLQAPPSLAAFFAELARAGGGRLTVISDQQAQLPVFADLNGNYCTDRSDAMLVARAFGQTGAPQDNPLDLNADGKVGFADYSLAVTAFTPGGCGTIDPYTARAPIVCTSSQPITIDGQVIEQGGITIDAQSTCKIKIKNSLIVAGQSAIRIQGSAILTIDNSILVGEGAWLTSDGSVSLSAANTVFHGRRVTEGAYVYVNRGGNIFE